MNTFYFRLGLALTSAFAKLKYFFVLQAIVKINRVLNARQIDNDLHFCRILPIMRDIDRLEKQKNFMRMKEVNERVSLMIQIALQQKNYHVSHLDHDF